MSSPKLPRPKTMMFVSALLCVVLVPLVYAAVYRTAEEQRHYDEIAKMTERDRLQLEHNFKTFQQLSPAQQEKYRQLHSQLNGEYKEFKQVLNEYNEFLRSLDPVDRSNIDRETKFMEKMQAIENVNNKLNDEAQRLQELLQESFANTQRNSGRWHVDPLSPEEIDSLTRVLEAHQNVTVAQKTLLQTLPPVDRLAEILSIVLTESGRSESKPLFNSQLTNELIAGLSDKRRDFFQRSKERYDEAEQKFAEEVNAGEADPDNPPFTLRRSLEEQHAMFLIGTCLHSFNQALTDAAPSPEKMPAFLKELPPEVRIDFLNQRPGDLYQELVKEYYRKKPTRLSEATKIIQEQFNKKMPKGPPRERRPGAGRPGGGGFGSGGGERPEIPRGKPPAEGNERGRPQGAGFPERIRDFRGDRRENSRNNNSSTQSAD